MLITVFMKVLDMTKATSIVILFVLLARLLLKRAPKVFSYALWALVLFRLLCPVSIEAPASILPEIAPVSDSYTLADVPISPVNAGAAAYQAVGDAFNGGLGVQQIPTEIPDGTGGVEHVSSLWWEVWVLFGQYVWLAGMAVMAVYAIVSYQKLHKQLLTASPVGRNIYLADGITSPFVMGLIRPKIYLPSSMEQREQSHILLHEQHHIRRLDHIFKALGFLALCIHWFNPLVWLAFLLSTKDMEMSCDEAVVKQLGEEIRADYTASLLSLATGRRIIAGMPLAFGEGDTKGRIYNLARWKKPALWVILASIVLCIALAAALLTDPTTSRTFEMKGIHISDLEPERIVTQIAKVSNLEDVSQVKVNASNFELFLTSDFEWRDSQAIRFFYTRNKVNYSAQLRLFPEEKEYYITEPSQGTEENRTFLFQLYLEALKYLPQEQVKSLAPDADSYIVSQVEDGIPGGFEHAITYTPDGAGDIEGWFIHLQVLPLYASIDGGYFGGGEEAIHLFYSRDMEDGELASAAVLNQATEWFDYTDNPSGVYKDSELTAQLPEFPGITFHYTSYDILVSEEGGEPESLISGMPIWNAYFCDLTGDKLPEICATVSYGSGMIDERVIICDYANGVSYSLVDRGSYDYRLSLRDDRLYVTKRVYNSQEVVECGYLAFLGNTLTIVKIDSDVSELVPGTTYVPYQCISMNLASSIYPFGGDSGYRYLIRDGYFAEIPRNRSAILAPDYETYGPTIPVTQWKWQSFPYSDEEWHQLYLLSSSSIPNITQQYEKILYQPLNEEKFLLWVDGEIWLVKLSQDGQGRTYIWSIYSLVPEASMGVAQWEFAPILSSRAPVFTFALDMPYTQITATCSQGVLTEFNYGSTSDTSLTIPAGKAIHWAPSQDGMGVSGDTTIRFTVHDGEKTPYHGTLYISSGGTGNAGIQLYTASLVGTGLHLSPNPEGEGAIISLVGGSS